jgi:dCMP deaminase
MKDNYYMALAFAASIRSRCQQAQVGCVLVKDDRVISTGYNGTLPGAPNCDSVACQAEHKGVKLCLTIHAEINAIQQARCDLTGAEAYVTRMPCLSCALALILAGVTKIYYTQENSWFALVSQMLSIQAPHVKLTKLAKDELVELIANIADLIG